MKRYWGAYGSKPDDTPTRPVRSGRAAGQAVPQPGALRRPVERRLLYVCDRANDRIQVFRPDGTFVKETFLAKNTKASGSAWDVAFSRDPQQRYHLRRRRQEQPRPHRRARTLQLLTSFGDGGRQPGQFFGVHSIATDSQGNIYTTET